MSNAQKSNLFVLLIGDGAQTEAFTQVAALTDTSLKVTKNSIDTTTKDTNGWQEMLEGGGQKSVQITASMMSQLDEPTQDRIKALVFGNTNANVQVRNEAGDLTKMRAHISEYEETGQVNGVVTAKITLMSDGVVTYTKAP